jgi:hypothetical protein
LRNKKLNAFCPKQEKICKWNKRSLQYEEHLGKRTLSTREA